MLATSFYHVRVRGRSIAKIAERGPTVRARDGGEPLAAGRLGLGTPGDEPETSTISLARLSPKSGIFGSA
jgi:hypothetical protein